MQQNEKTIRSALKKLRKQIETSTDPVVITISYEVECALRWATEDTVNWPSPPESALQAAETLRELMP